MLIPPPVSVTSSFPSSGSRSDGGGALRAAPLGRGGGGQAPDDDAVDIAHADQLHALRPLHYLLLDPLRLSTQLPDDCLVEAIYGGEDVESLLDGGDVADAAHDDVAHV
eukprot:CAMPEP_0177488766 /NCGR_PEP_ID=MMETSP0369-20130122/30338_1 /TAXON_ID=447022 ORGANISM="Scrippsiella hangoei-like, Strain SHHI-4" /NCGR_SAMPLE_ID=MMETSP0369 /ASSEMBLY_ACC=CAM_ASM_000364 /LENGTH=108 /DNA_ID=CAMNT_0018965171 /DNA_START=275 /DNA_END=601 /DNA_ORIENTATION=+